MAEILTAVENASPVAAAAVVGERLVRTGNASQVSFLIADFSGRALIRLSHADGGEAGREHDGDTAERVSLDGTSYAEVLRTQRVRVDQLSDSWRVLAPVTNRGEAIGVLEVHVPADPGSGMRSDIALAAHALAYVVIANRRFTDFYEWGQRTVPLSLAAEIQHRLLPDSYTCEAGQFSLAGWLEPAGEVAGDTFDFSLARDTLHLSVTDAMGHSVEAALLATVLVGALRNARRARVDLRQQARLASQSLAAHFHEYQYVTGQLVRIDLRTQTAQIVNAGHPLPLLLREGQVSAVELRANVPFGLGDHSYQVQSFDLRPGDRLIFLTDGVLERNAASLRITDLILSGAAMHPRQAVQLLIEAAIAGSNGKLRDDAAVLCLDWHGGPPRLRSSHAGADSPR